MAQCASQAPASRMTSRTAEAMADLIADMAVQLSTPVYEHILFVLQVLQGSLNSQTVMEA